MRSTKDIRADFPIFKRKIHGKPLVYLDNAATTQKPKQVIEAMNTFYTTMNANIHRGVHTLSEESTLAYEEAHETLAKFINANARNGELIFTSGATASINTISYAFCLDQLKRGDEVLISEMEHHSNLVPWQQLAAMKGAKLKVVKMNEDWEIDLEDLKKKVTSKTKIASVTHMSNVLGTINDIKAAAEILHDKHALLAVDGAQSAPHFPIDVQKLDCDFFVCSGHKMLGPTGTGILYGKEELLQHMNPFMYGGDMIRSVAFTKTTWNDLPWKFEAGTPDIAGGIGLAAAVNYLQKEGMEEIHAHETKLTHYALKQLASINGLTLYGKKETKMRGGVISFNLRGIHAHDVASILDREGIAIRAGHHCAQPLLEKLNLPATARLSLYLYNTKEEIDHCVQSLENVKKVFA